MKLMTLITSRCKTDIDRILSAELRMKTMFKLNLYIISLNILFIKFWLLFRLNCIKDRLLNHFIAFIMMFK